jgi:hypothetical protein
MHPVARAVQRHMGGRVGSATSPLKQATCTCLRKMSLHDMVDVRSFAKYAQGQFGRLLAAPTIGWIVVQASALDSAFKLYFCAMSRLVGNDGGDRRRRRAKRMVVLRNSRGRTTGRGYHWLGGGDAGWEAAGVNPVGWLRQLYTVQGSLYVKLRNHCRFIHTSLWQITIIEAIQSCSTILSPFHQLQLHPSNAGA